MDPCGEVLRRARELHVRFVSLQFTDLLGSVKSVTIPLEELPESFKYGTWFDGSSVEGFARICESDMLLKPDPSTFAVIPWLDGANVHDGADNNGRTARIICDIYQTSEKPFKADPRHILKEALSEVRKLGFSFYTGPELEFFLLRNNGLVPIPHDTGGYFDLTMDKAYEIRTAIMGDAERMGLHTETSHHECATGQHEIDLRYDEALRTADRVVTLKLIVKSVAERFSCTATFMPKPFFGVNGSGMHVHQSLWQARSNAFYDEKGRYSLSKTATGFIAGQLSHARALAGVVAPTVNSYKRLVPGYEAPVYVCWGRVNRSALIRVPNVSAGKWQSTRAELRCPDPSCNSYLAFAAMLRAGLDGMEKGLAPPEPVDGDVYVFDGKDLAEKGIPSLPETLKDALQEMRNDPVIRKALGDGFEKYLAIKEREWKLFSMQVSEWETKRYMDA